MIFETFESSLTETITEAQQQLRVLQAETLVFQAEINRARAAMNFFDQVGIDPNCLKFRQLRAAEVDMIAEFIKGLM